MTGPVVWNPVGLAELAAEVTAGLKRAGDRVAAAAAATAPHRTGAGAASIHAETVLAAGGWQVHVGWDQLHDYMRFHERGTRYMPAEPFLVPALDRYATLGR